MGGSAPSTPSSVFEGPELDELVEESVDFDLILEVKASFRALLGADPYAENCSGRGAGERILIRIIVADINCQVAMEESARPLKRVPLMNAVAWQYADSLFSTDEPCCPEAAESRLNSADGGPARPGMAIVHGQRVGLVLNHNPRKLLQPLSQLVLPPIHPGGVGGVFGPRLETVITRKMPDRNARKPRREIRSGSA